MTKSVDILTVCEEGHQQRLDKWFKLKYPELTHSRLQKLIRTGQIRVNSKRVRSSTRLEEGQDVRVPRFKLDPTKASNNVKVLPHINVKDYQLIESMILFEDEFILVLNKPFGMAVQGGTGTRRHIDGILTGMTDRFGCRPRLVHRLDRDTTGVLLLAKSRNTAAKICQAFQTRSVEKLYWALVVGVPRPTSGTIEAALVKAPGISGDKIRKAQRGEQKEAMHATTSYSVVELVANKVSWVSLKPLTGRQHQLRAHMDIIGHPIIGDNKYNTQQVINLGAHSAKLHLHARHLAMPHPHTHDRIEVTAPLSNHMLETWKMLGLSVKAP